MYIPLGFKVIFKDIQKKKKQMKTLFVYILSLQNIKNTKHSFHDIGWPGEIYDPYQCHLLNPIQVKQLYEGFETG
jgi:hypothetical protein